MRRHPWVYSQAIHRVQGDPRSGETVHIRSSDGRWLASGAYSSESSIAVRVWSFVETEPIDAAFFLTRISRAVRRREGLDVFSNALRLVFGEADGLPGVVVDRFGNTLVIQLQSAGADYWRDAIVDALVAVTGCLQVYERSDGASRQREGLPLVSGPVRGDIPGLIPVIEHGVRLYADPVGGHKTGFYADQRDNRLLARQLASGRRVLNLFCYTGGFSIAALHGGAVEVLSVDSSAEAIAMGQRHEAENGTFRAPSEWRVADAFLTLRDLLADGRQFDMIILDPPKFAPSHRHVDRAARAYKEINLKALKLLAPEGLLMTYSCSGAIDLDLFQKILAGAVFDAGGDAQILRRLGAGEDHPVAMTHPEGEYLKGLLLRRV